MPSSVRKCPNCASDNHYRKKVCAQCGTTLIPTKGRPSGTTLEAGYRVGVNGDRPSGTTQEAGYRVGCRPRRKNVQFDKSIQLPTGWVDSKELVNASSGLLDACGRRIAQQRTFDKKPLGVAVCYGCGHLLWSCVDGARTFLVNNPSGMTKDNAPASAYLRTVSDCSAGFVYTERGNSTKEHLYCCPYCKSNQIPSDQHVGHILDASLNAKSVDQWDMSFQVEVKSLANQYERDQMSLCGLFSSTVREASMTQYRHLQGEVNAITKLDRHYHGLFGFLAIKDGDIWEKSPSPVQSICIKRAIRWMHANNHLPNFSLSMRHCFDTVSPALSTPSF